MHVNANNHALDGGPATSAMEVEVVAWLARCSASRTTRSAISPRSGTIANLEALWVARELHPGKAIVFGANAHYTHSRMCAVLGVRAFEGRRREGPARHGRGRGAAAQRATSARSSSPPARPARDGRRGRGAVELRERYGVRVHVDAAYGGFFTLLDEARRRRAASFRAIAARRQRRRRPPQARPAALRVRGGAVPRPERRAACTSTTRRTPTSPSGDLHLGEISLECSRAGAAAAALWLTLRSLDLAPDPVRRRARRPRLGRAAARLRRAAPAREPQLDIVTYFPTGARASEIDAASERVLNAGMTADDRSSSRTLRIDGDAFAAAHPDVEMDTDGVRVLRSVLMKPEHEPHVPWLHERVSVLVRDHGA